MSLFSFMIDVFFLFCLEIIHDKEDRKGTGIVAVLAVVSVWLHPSPGAGLVLPRASLLERSHRWLLVALGNF